MRNIPTMAAAGPALLLSISLATACGPGLTTHPVAPGANARGVTYALPKTVVQLDATALYYRTAKILNDKPTPVDVFGKTEATVTITTTADRERLYSLDIGPARNSADELGVELYDTGLLKSINITSDGKVGDVIKAVITVVAVVAAAVLALDGEPEFALSDEIEKKLDPVAKRFYEAEKHKPAFRFAVTGLSPLQRYVVRKDAAAANTWLHAQIESKHVLDLVARRHELFATAAKDQDLDKTLERLGKLETEAQRRRQALQTTFEVQVDAYAAANELKRQEMKTQLSERFDALDLPPLCVVEAGDMRLAELDKRLLTYYCGDQATCAAGAQAKRTLQLTRTLPAIDVRTTKGACPTTPAELAPAADTDACEGANNNGKVAVYYRRALHTRVVTFAQVQAYTPAQPGQASTYDERFVAGPAKDVAVIDTRQTPSCLVLTPSQWTKRQLGLAFDPQGLLKEFKGSGGAEAAAAAQAVADAAIAARDTYAGTLSKVVEIQENRRKIQLDATTTAIERLKQQKELLDAKLAAQGASATYDDVAAKQRLDAELQRLQAEIAVESGREGAADSVEAARLKQELDALRQEFDLLKTQLELQKLREEQKKLK